jgi:HD superfamily phosphohydrolase
MSTVTFADVVHQLIDFSTENKAEATVLRLIDTPWFQRLRDISQTANTRLVYMFSEHSRFGHSIGVAHLAKLLMDRLSVKFPDEVSRFRSAVLFAATLHDIGHLAPGSHTAFKAWFPDQPDSHEELSVRIIREDSRIAEVLNACGPQTIEDVCSILSESSEVPPWTWEIISGGGWNVDRGNWCIVDSILAGVNYGRYNVAALTEAIQLSSDKHLVLSESRLDAMMHFTLSRHAMYRQVYQHRVLLAADTLYRAVVQRARDLGPDVPFADEVMTQVLRARSPEDLTLDTVFWMRESWWRYHLMRWSQGGDSILADLASRLLERRLFKTVRIHEVDSPQALREQAVTAVVSAGFDPQYYLHVVSTSDVHTGDYQSPMLVQMDDGRLRHLTDAEPLFQALVRESRGSTKQWLALPEKAKRLLGRVR